MKPETDRERFERLTRHLRETQYRRFCEWAEPVRTKEREKETKK